VRGNARVAAEAIDETRQDVGELLAAVDLERAQRLHQRAKGLHLPLQQSLHFGELGFDCREAADGLEALQSAQRSRPDLILMDLKMPGMDGFEATRLIRIIEPLKDVPVIVISANIAEDSVALCLAAGANAFLSKPIEEAELLRIVARVAGVEWVTEGETERASGDGDASLVAA